MRTAPISRSIPLLLLLALAACKQDAPAAAPAAGEGALASAAGAPSAPALSREETQRRALEALRKQVPDYERLGAFDLVGDLDKDGRDDVVVVYGDGTADATLPAAQKFATILSRPEGPKVVVQDQIIDSCVQPDRIENQRFYATAIDICAAPRPGVLAFVSFAWDGKALVQADSKTLEQYVQGELGALGQAFAKGDRKAVLAHMKFPRDVNSLWLQGEALAKAAQAKGGQVDAALAERYFQDLFPDHTAKRLGEMLEMLAQGKSVTSENGDVSLVGKRRQGELDSWATALVIANPEEGDEEATSAQAELRIDGGLGKNIDLDKDGLGDAMDREGASQDTQSLQLYLIDGKLRIPLNNAAG